MMAKRKAASYMTPGEQIAGVIFFLIYLLVLPFATAPLFRLAETLLGTGISEAMRNVIYYYILPSSCFVANMERQRFHNALIVSLSAHLPITQQLCD